jgi:hypothetical protein
VTLLALVFAGWRFRFASRPASRCQVRREARRARKLAQHAPHVAVRLPDPDQAKARWPRLLARVGLEAR